MRARTFLNWFRQLRLDPQASHRLRWLLAGSIGLDTVTRRMRLGDTIFSELRGYCGDRSVEPTPAAVDAACESLLSPGKKAYFDYWEQRLAEELGQPEDRHAVSLLNAVARDPEDASLTVLRGVLGERIQDPEDRDEQLRYLLDVLLSDGYLIATGDRYQFRSSLLRDFWLRRILP